MKVDLADVAVREAATGKLAHAISLANTLRVDMDAWWNTGPVALSVELRDDERTVDFVMTTSPMPPLDDWQNRASDVLQNLRNSLNRLTNTVCRLCLGNGKPADTSYPIHKAQEGWEQWLRKHPELPPDIAQRFLDFEPFVSGRPYLLDLSAANNSEKHDAGFSVSVTLTEMKLGGLFTVEGLWKDDHLEEGVQLLGGQTLDITNSRQVIGTVKMPTRILEFQYEASDVESQFTLTPMIHLEDRDDIPFFPGVEIIRHEVMWAIAHVTGLVNDAIRPPHRIDL